MAPVPSLQTSGLTPQLKRAIAAAVVIIVAFVVGCVLFVVFYNRASRKGQPAHIGEKAHYPSVLDPSSSSSGDPEKALESTTTTSVGSSGSDGSASPVSMTPGTSSTPGSGDPLISVTPPPAAVVNGAEKGEGGVKAKNSWRGSLRSKRLDALFGTAGSRHSNMSTDVPMTPGREFV